MSAKRRKGTKRYRGRVTGPDGVQRERGYPTPKEALAWEDAQKRLMGDGRWVDPSQKMMFGELLDEWRASSLLRIQPKTLMTYDSVARCHLHRWRDVRLQAITTPALELWAAELTATLSVESVRKIIALTGSVLQLGVDRDYLKVNRARQVKLPRPQRNTDPIILDHAEGKTLEAEMPPAYRLFYLAALYTGARSGELRALQVKDFERAAGTLRISKGLKEVSKAIAAQQPKRNRIPGCADMILGPTKTFQARTVALPAFLRDALAAALPIGAAPQTFIFTTPDGSPIRQSNFYRKVWQPAVRRALPPEKHGLRWHDLRHSCASMAVAAGAPPLQIADLLGHSDVRTTMAVYAHLYPSAGAALAAGLDAAYAAAEAAPLADVVALRRS